MTATKNIPEHQQAIKMETLPATLRDAVTITRLLGFRYLWIDALCILQDNLEDWNREAARMCSVYESAVLSLSILDSESSISGFLRPRDIQNTLVTVIGTNLGIRPPVSRPQQSIPGSHLETRAWTMQERILAPALLHFGSDQLYWECCAGLASETHPEIREERTAENDSYFGRSVHDMKVLLRNQVQAQSVDLWHTLVENYTQRRLTNSADRLPAIRGLATKFKDCLDGAYLSGIWSKSMYLGLLWAVSAEGSVPAKTTSDRNTAAPSWSWACFETPVTYTFKPSTTRGNSVVQRARIELLPDSKGSASGDIPEQLPGLQIGGLLQKGVCYRTSRRSRHCEFVAPTSHSIFDRIKCVLDHVSDEVGKGTLILKEYHCLLVAEQRNDSSSTEYYYLVLEKVQGTHSNMFKRAGVGWQEVFNGYESGLLAGALQADIILV